jgi:hypothetical protein
VEDRHAVGEAEGGHRALRDTRQQPVAADRPPDQRAGAGAGGRLAGCDEGERCACVAGLGNRGFRRRPETERFERGLAVLACRHRFDLRNRQAAPAEQHREIGVRADLDRRGVPAMGDQDERVAEWIGARALDHETRLLDLVHPVHGDRQTRSVGRGARYDLPGASDAA